MLVIFHLTKRTTSLLVFLCSIFIDATVLISVCLVGCTVAHHILGIKAGTSPVVIYPELFPTSKHAG